MSAKPNDNAKWLFYSVVVLAAVLLILAGHEKMVGAVAFLVFIIFMLGLL